MFISTRGDSTKITASEAILYGIAKDSGLYVIDNMPHLDMPLENLVMLDYKNMAYEILKLFLDDFSKEEIVDCIDKAYDSKFDDERIAPLVKFSDYYFLELFHGKTLAFKDMALSILPHLMRVAKNKQDLKKEIIILVATSGDTGKAALEGFRDVDGIKVIVFYPINGVSNIQKLQMQTQEGKNTFAIGIEGNFDDAQTEVKKIFNDEGFNKELDKKGYVFSSANSINIGRLIPQIVYYFYAYASMVKDKYIDIYEKINITVPTGNFGNILAAYIAKKMGLPVNKLICASNSNKVLYDFFRSKVYDKDRDFVTTMSPSMDILVSSNLERLLFMISQDAKKTKLFMEELYKTGKYEFDFDLSEFYGEFADEKETLDSIKKVFELGYLIDTHTAVAVSAYDKYVKKTNDLTKNLIVSTASPYKFPEDVLSAILSLNKSYENYEAIKALSDVSKTNIPNNIKDIFDKEVFHKAICKTYEMKQCIKDIVLEI